MKEFIKSSANENNLSLTVKGILVALIPVLIFFGNSAGLDITENDLMQVINAITAVLSSVMMLYGVSRKIYYKVIKKFSD
ncbi:hypothetical protein [Persephonella sp.]